MLIMYIELYSQNMHILNQDLHSVVAKFSFLKLLKRSCTRLRIYSKEIELGLIASCVWNGGTLTVFHWFPIFLAFCNLLACPFSFDRLLFASLLFLFFIFNLFSLHQNLRYVIQPSFGRIHLYVSMFHISKNRPVLPKFRMIIIVALMVDLADISSFLPFMSYTEESITEQTIFHFMWAEKDKLWAELVSAGRVWKDIHIFFFSSSVYRRGM